MCLVLCEALGKQCCPPFRSIQTGRGSKTRKRGKYHTVWCWDRKSIGCFGSTQEGHKPRLWWSERLSWGKWLDLKVPISLSRKEWVNKWKEITIWKIDRSLLWPHLASSYLSVFLFPFIVKVHKRVVCTCYLLILFSYSLLSNIFPHQTALLKPSLTLMPFIPVYIFNLYPTSLLRNFCWNCPISLKLSLPLPSIASESLGFISPAGRKWGAIEMFQAGKGLL